MGRIHTLPLGKPKGKMENLALNQTQVHLLKMFSYAKSDREFAEIKSALSCYFAERSEAEMDKLWDGDGWNDEMNEQVLSEHLRTPYHG